MSLLIIVIPLLALLLTGVPIFAGLGLFGAGVLWFMQGGVGPIAEIMMYEISRYLLVTIPLFAFMAHVMIRSKVIDDLYSTAFTLTRHLPGGLSIATIGACAIFSAISGSSVATALTIGSVAIPQMIRYGYDPRSAYGLVAAGGTLGILIPPSGPMILYGVVTETSIGSLFMAGVVPGIFVAFIFIVYAVFKNIFSKSAVKTEPRASIKEILEAIKNSFWALCLPFVVLGGMYLGVFTATEAAATGALAAVVVGLCVYKTIGLKDLWAAAEDAAQTAAMLFMIVAGASVFSYAITKLRIPQQLVEWLISINMEAGAFILLMMALIFVLGMFLESIAIILLTMPVIMPAMIHLGINPIWYGVLLVISLEIAQITPPVGMNLFTIKAITQAPLFDIIVGALPYVFLLIFALLCVFWWPEIALWLPRSIRNAS